MRGRAVQCEFFLLFYFFPFAEEVKYIGNAPLSFFALPVGFNSSDHHDFCEFTWLSLVVQPNINFSETVS